MKNTIMILVAAISFGSTLTAQISFSPLSYQEGFEKAKQNNQLLFVDVFTTWCGPCKMLSSNVFPDEELGNVMNQSFVNIKVDGDDESNYGMMEQFEVSAFPTMLLIDPRTDRVRKIEGYVQADEIIREANYALDPESSPVAHSKREFENDPSRNNHRSLIESMLNDREMNDESLSKEAFSYVDQYPKLDLGNDMDLYVFLVTITDLSNENMQQFISTLDNHDSDIIQFKLIQLIQNSIEKAIIQNDMSIATKTVDELFPIFENHIDEDLSSEEIKLFILDQFEQ